MTEHHRKPPLYPYRPGFCVWCNGAIVPRLKKDGTPHAIQASWHRDCALEYRMAAGASPFLAMLVERDGRKCKLCGKERTTLIVDHIIPLWKVRDLEIEARRGYFMPGNLQLLCDDGPESCNRRKTDAEAIERAHVKRLEARSKPARGPLIGRDGQRLT